MSPGRRATVAVAALLCAVQVRAQAPPSPSVSPTTAAPVAARIAAVAFMAGHWVGDVDGALSEEVWTAPAGGSMLGMWRLVAGGQARVLELLALSEEPDGGLALRLRHFDARLVAREDKDTPVELRLRRVSEGDVSFEGLGSDGTPVRLDYRRDGPDGLAAVLERRGRRDEFRYRRRAPAAP